MIKNAKFKLNRGVLESFGTVLPYSLIPLIFLINFAGSNNFGNSFVKGMVLTQGKDFLSTFIYIIMVFFTRNTHNTLRVAKNGKISFLIALSSICGGPLGYTCYNTAFYLAGPSFGHVFTSLEPIFLGLFAIFYMKRKFKWQMWMGVCLTVGSTVAMVFGASFVTNNFANIIAGSILGIFGAVFWSIESILFDRCVDLYGKEDITPLLCWKMIYAMIFSFAFMFPIGGAIVNDAGRAFRFFSEFFTKMDYFWRFILAGSLIVIGRWLYFDTIKYLGSTYTSIIYGLTIITIPIFNLIYYGFSGNYIGGTTIANEQLNLRFQVVFWSLVPIMLAGTTLVTLYRPSIDRDWNKSSNSEK